MLRQVSVRMGEMRRVMVLLGASVAMGMLGCMCGPPPSGTGAQIESALSLPKAGAVGQDPRGPIVLVAAQTPMAAGPELAAPVNPSIPALPLETTPLGIDDVLQRCLSSDPTLRAGLESINQADADLLTASLKPNPEAYTDVQMLPLGRPYTIADPGGPPQSDLLVAYPIDWFLFGKRAAAMMTARAGVRVSEAQYADLIRQRLRDAALAHYDLLEAKAKLKASESVVGNARRLEAGARKIGRPATELQRIRLHLLSAENELRLARAGLISARARLRVFLGQLHGAPEVDVSGSLDLAADRPHPQAEELYELARQNRPDLLAMELQIAQARADVVSQRRQAYPAIAPQFGYTYQFQNSIGDRDAASWDAALTMEIPLFDRNQGGRARAASVLTQNTHQLHGGLVGLHSEVEQLLQDFIAAETNAQAVTQAQVNEADAVRDKLIKAYAAGKQPLLDVLDAQKNYHDTYDLFVSTHAGYWRAAVKLNAAVGQAVVP